MKKWLYLIITLPVQKILELIHWLQFCEAETPLSSKEDKLPLCGSMLSDYTWGEGVFRCDGREWVRTLSKAPDPPINWNNHSRFHEKILEWKQIRINNPQEVLVITLFNSQQERPSASEGLVHSSTHLRTTGGWGGVTRGKADMHQCQDRRAWLHTIGRGCEVKSYS